MMIDVITLFKDFYDPFLQTSIIKRAIRDHKVTIHIHDLRDYAHNKHRQVDDTPYGGGVGMLIQFPPVYDAVMALKKEHTKVFLMSPQGKIFKQHHAKKLSKLKHMILICGHYEGVDARVLNIVDGEISIGDVVLTNGEIPAMLVMDAIIRLIPDVIMEASYQEDSLYQGLLKYPQYTKPFSYQGYDVPEILLSGHHENIMTWRQQKQIEATYLKRPDLLRKKQLNPLQKKHYEQLKNK
jgi:tRNA (guanine37-N1)-methyltransferase